MARLPRRELAARILGHEQRWLPVLAPRLPLPVPAPARVGRPGLGYPWPWSIVPFLPGQVAARTPPDDPRDAAVTLGRFLAALHTPAPPDAPVNAFRGIPLADRRENLVHNLAAVGGGVDHGAVWRVWDLAVAAPVWAGPPLWLHGDLHPASLLVHRGRLSGVIDFGDITSGDPATDLSIGWMLLPAEQHGAFLDAYTAGGGAADEGGWTRARAGRSHSRWCTWPSPRTTPCWRASASEPSPLCSADRWAGQSVGGSGYCGQVLESFHPAVRAWFARRFPDGPTEPQAEGWQEIAAGRHTLIAAPTGSGKTLAAFLVCIDRIYRAHEATVAASPGVQHCLFGPPDTGLDDAAPTGPQVVYVSPLKALAVDIQLNLERPLAEIAETAAELGLSAPTIRVAVRTGDTAAAERAAMLRRPPDFLITTPESLYLLVTAEKSRSMLATARTVIVDEIHAVAGNKRGSHLALTLERLEHVATGGHCSGSGCRPRSGRSSAWPGCWSAPARAGTQPGRVTALLDCGLRAPPRPRPGPGAARRRAGRGRDRPSRWPRSWS